MKDSDPALNFQEQLKFTVTRAGNINRSYGTAVYSVQDGDGTAVYSVQDGDMVILYKNSNLPGAPGIIVQ